MKETKSSTLESGKEEISCSCNDIIWNKACLEQHKQTFARRYLMKYILAK